MAFDDLFLTDLRQRNDIETVISSYVTLKRKGKLLGGLCPFHNEKTPSFYVYPETQSYYCYGCGSGGDVITFIKNIENINYAEAVKFLCDKSGIALPDDNFDSGLSKKRTRMYEMNREAARFFYKQLFEPNGEIARKYCKYRQLSKETIKKFGIGYAPEGWSNLKDYLNAKGFSDIELYEADLVKKSSKGRYYDTFRNRLVFPVIDIRGNVVGFSGRRLNEEDNAKYVNTGDTLVYKKGREIFALNYVKQITSDNIILCEGNIDVVMLHQAGFTNAVAALGTALTQDQAQALSRYTGEIVLCYDSDEAGQKAVNKAMGIFANTTLRVKVINLKGGKDPDEIIKKFGASRFKSLIEGASNDVEYKLLLEKEKFDVETPDGKVNFMKSASNILAQVKSPIEVDIYASKLASDLSVNKEAILREIQNRRKTYYKKQKIETTKHIQQSIDNPNDNVNKVNPERRNNIRASKAEERLIASLMNNPNFYKSIRSKISADDFVTSFNRRLYAVISQRLDEDKPVDISYIASSFTSEEISAIAGIMASAQLISNTVSECEDCIKVIKSEKDRSVYNNASELSSKEFLGLFRKDEPKENNT